MEEYCNPLSNCEKGENFGKKQYGIKESEGPLGNTIENMWEHIGKMMGT